jgi:chromate transporter
MDETVAEKPQATHRTSLREVAMLFLRLGTTAFGGPAAHIAMMEDECVRRRHWVTQEKFLDLLGAVNLIPGPNSTEMAIYLGYLRAGWRGLLLGGVCFIFPAMLMVTAIAWAYLRFGSLPQFTGLLYGVKPVVIAVVLQALWGLGHKAVKTRFLAAIALLATAASFYNVGAITVLLLAGVVTALERGRGQKSGKRLLPISTMLLAAGGILAFSYIAAHVGSSVATPFSPRSLFLYFLKVGSVLYGSGYVLLAFLQADLVNHWHWLTSSQLLDCIATIIFPV